MTQQEFADHVGVPRLWVAQVETGKTNPTLSRVLDVVRRAGLSLSLDASPEGGDRHCGHLARRVVRREDVVERGRIAALGQVQRAGHVRRRAVDC